MSQTLIGPGGWELLYCTVIVCIGGVWLWWSGRPHPRWEAFKRATLAVWTSRFPVAKASDEKAEEPAPNQSAVDKAEVQNQSDKAGTKASTTAAVSGKTAADQPAVIVAASPQIDGIVTSTRMTDREMAIFLALQRREDGSWRHSANAIHKLLGGARDDVLALIRQVRPGDAEAKAEPAKPVEQPKANSSTSSARFRLTPEQQQFRQKFELDRPAV
ncbi:MAG TPA: hypothetical protein VFS21_14645 [Roseiflexaceae bacterium]|nr:hypothetical protein [Roseiflexaceae bacterium]